jgi:hypothetical protein
MVSEGLRWVTRDKVPRDQALQSEALAWRVKGWSEMGDWGQGTAQSGPAE